MSVTEFQLRHTEFGIYQGSCIGLGFWYPMSDLPELGLCKFPSIEEAEKHRAFCVPKLIVR